MLAISPSVPIYLHAEAVDMRKSFDGLFGIIKNELERDVRNGGLFMFLNHRRNRVKLLYWDTDGIAIWMKRLERGCFQRPLRNADGKHVMVTPAELQWILSGIELESIRKRKRYTVTNCLAS
ncbi:MAG: IS66 family insertion sequence element accessory protein TnpB [Planctomycetes bacterium]|jgi:transposase|nr:IS66 family insertion sequence element accessory protein TnpB [Planctomycetota bacterium]